MITRRKFVIGSAMAAAGTTLSFVPGKDHDINPVPAPASRFPVRLFSKPLDAYDFSFMCECVKRSGLEGFDLTVRSGGKVEPSEVETKLPKLVEEARKYNLAVDMMVSGIVNATDPLTERVLRTASAAGISHYRLGYLDFDYKAGIWESLQKHKESLKPVVDLNMKYNIHGDYQNHEGTRVGGPVWDLYELLKGFPSEHAGCQYDVRHAMVEGAFSWILGMRLIAPSIKTLAIKDFTWMTVKGKPSAVTVPLGEGMVSWDVFFRTVKELNISGPLTIHIEYPLLGEGEDKLPLQAQQDIIVKKIKKDADFLKAYLDKYQLT